MSLSGAECLEYYAGLAAGIAGEHLDLGPQAFGYTRREPLGVVAGIGAWNYPLQIACWKSAPALACGNAMIFKPAELTPLTAMKLEEIYIAAGVPRRAVPGRAGLADTGRLLTRHPQIRKVSLTGEVGTGKAVMADAAGSLKQRDTRARGQVAAHHLRRRQARKRRRRARCSATSTRPARCAPTARGCSCSAAVCAARSSSGCGARTAALRIGDPLDPAHPGGRADHPRSTWRRCSASSPAAVREGARLVTGGSRVTSGDLASGFFVAPTVFDGCQDDMDIVREEIFGPVMSVLEFEDEEEVVARANATEFGLSAGGIHQ